MNPFPQKSYHILWVCTEWSVQNIKPVKLYTGSDTCSANVTA